MADFRYSQHAAGAAREVADRVPQFLVMAARRWLSVAMMVAIATTLGLGAAAQDTSASEIRLRPRHRARGAGQPRRGAVAPLGSIGRWRRATPTSRTGSAKLSTASAPSTLRSTPTAARWPNGPSFRQASNNLILALVKVGKGPEAIALAQKLVHRSAHRSGQVLHARPRPVGAGLRGRDPDVPQGPRAGAEAHPRALQPRARPAASRSPRRGASGAAAIDRQRAARRGLLHDGRDLLAPGRARPGASRPSVRRSTLKPGYADAHYALGSVLKAKGDLA